MCPCSKNLQQGRNNLPIDTHPQTYGHGEQRDDVRVVVGEKDEDGEDEEETVEGEVHDFLRDGVVFGSEDRGEERFPEWRWGVILR